MLNNTLKSVFRTIKKYKGYSFINIAGLSIGMACAILIFFWVQHEISFDRFHKKADSIYRITNEITTNNNDKRFVTLTSPLMARGLVEDFPEIESSTRISWLDEIYIRHKNEIFKEEKGFYADSTFFQVFAFPLIRGNSNSALASPKSILLTSKLANKYFGNADPLGKTLMINGENYVVTGILKDVPTNSHLQFNFILSSRGHPNFTDTRWSYMLVNTYITVKNQTNINLLQEKIQSLNNKFGGDWAAKYFRFELQPIRAIHLHSNLLAEYAPQTNISLIYIFSAIGFLILIIASINYINLTIAIFNRRIQEIGIRKALGANRFRIGLQFMGESFFLVLISFFISLALVKLFFPVFSTVIPGEIQLNFNQGLVIACGITFALAALSGIYPAFHLSSLHTHLLIRGKNRRVPSSPMIRKMLIGFQFTITIVLVIATSVIYSQMHYIINKDVRFDKKQLIRIPVYRQQLKSRLESLKTEFLKVPGVVSVSVSSSVPFESTQFRAFRPEGFQDKEISSSVILVDQDYIETYAMEIISGQNFSVENPKGYIINETAAKRFGWTDPIGKEIEWAAGDRIGGIDKERVIGVVKDFHFENFRKEIQPLVLRVRPEYFNLLTVRYNRSDVAGMLSQLKQVWEKFDNEFPFNYSFLDEVFNKTYGDEKRLTGELLYLSIISILIASMGLCGLISFMAQQKTKEIGIRKVHGATKTSIVFLLTKDFLKLVIVANVIAWPMSYYLANGWLNNFIYRTSINPIIFIGASVIVLIIALFTISFQSIKAAMANPADSLKYE